MDLYQFSHNKKQISYQKYLKIGDDNHKTDKKDLFKALR